MRFSYIDSQGKEIDVDSVESLALRIELGAIKADTRMYDAVADRWAPAEEHPVFRSLSRGEKVGEDDVVHIGQEVPPEDAPPEEGTVPEAGGGSDASDSAETEATDGELDLDFQVTLSDDEEQLAAEEEAGEREEAPRGDEGGESGDEEGDDPFGDLDVLEPEEPATAESGESGGGEPSTEAGDEAGDVETDHGPEPGSDEEDPFTEGASSSDPAPPSDDAPPSEEDALPAWAAEGEALWDDEPESPEAGEGEGGESGTGTRTAPSESRPDAGPPPDPEDRMPEWAADEPEDEGSAPAETEKRRERRGRDEGRQERPAPPRPAHWEERARAGERRRRLVRIAAIVVLLAAVGGTTAYVLDLGPLGAEGPGESAEVPTRPVLPSDLRAVMTEVSSAAYDDVLARFREEWADREVADRPPPQWLDGIYLSTAGDFPGVRSYWEAVRTGVSSLRASESDLFRERLEERLAERVENTGGGDGSGELSPDESSRVQEAALVGFRLTAPERGRRYERVLGVAEASLELHGLLVEREGDIDYEPYSDPGVSRDPVLEAVPADSLLRVEMNERLDRVLESVVESELPRPITTTTLLGHLLDDLREVGVVAPPPSSPDGAGSP